jgi:hypothetical protein
MHFCWSQSVVSSGSDYAPVVERTRLSDAEIIPIISHCGSTKKLDDLIASLNFTAHGSAPLGRYRRMKLPHGLDGARHRDCRSAAWLTRSEARTHVLLD